MDLLLTSAHFSALDATCDIYMCFCACLCGISCVLYAADKWLRGIKLQKSSTIRKLLKLPNDKMP